MFTLLRESLARVLATAGKGLAISLVIFVSSPAWLESTARAAVIISEVMANPETGSEWIELANVGEEAQDIYNYSLYDTVSSPTLLHTFAEEMVVGPQETLVIGLDGSKLNNTGDTVNLYDHNGAIISSVTYGDTTKGLSWNYDQTTQNYLEHTPTPDTILVTTIQTPSPSPTPSPQAAPSPAPTPTPIPEPSPNLPAPLQTPKENTSQIKKEELFAQLAILLPQYQASFQLTSEPLTTATTSATVTDQVTTESQNFIPISPLPPKSGIISLIVGGILIATAGYSTLYVLEQKKLTTR